MIQILVQSQDFNVIENVRNELEKLVRKHAFINQEQLKRNMTICGKELSHSNSGPTSRYLKCVTDAKEGATKY